MTKKIRGHQWQYSAGRATHIGQDRRELGTRHIELLLQRYADTPMSLADGCLVRLSEVHKDCRVLTLDKHFKHYRRYGRSVIPLISPW